VNVLPAMTSFYRWRGRVEREAERQLVIKTTRERTAAVQVRLTALHPYELPEFVIVSVSDGSAAYLGWIREQTAEPDVSSRRLSSS
jgi:periplasmic divalent cation tolerance protein